MSTCPFAAPLWRTGSRTATQTPSAASLLAVFGTRPESQKWRSAPSIRLYCDNEWQNSMGGGRIQGKNAECRMWIAELGNTEFRIQNSEYTTLRRIWHHSNTFLCGLCAFARPSNSRAKTQRSLLLFWVKKSPNSVIRQIKAPPQRVRGWCRARTGVPAVRGNARARW
jgi:hypothetical protein